MDKQAFKQRMQNLKSYRENNPGKGYWDWKVQAYQNGGDIPLWQQYQYSGPSYQDVLDDLKQNSPSTYNQLQQSKAADSQSSSEIVRYVDSKGRLQSTSNLQGLSPVITSDYLPGIGDAMEVTQIVQDVKNEDYVNQANEKHAQTWDFRGNNSNLKDDQGNYYIDPNRQLTPEDISNMRSKGAKIPEQWESLEDADISELTNTFAYNLSQDPIYFMANGGEIGDPDDEFTKAINTKLGRTPDGRPLQQGLKPVFDLEDAANLTPVGDAIAAKDMYNAAMDKDWTGLGLAAASMIPFVPSGMRKINKKFKQIPSVHKDTQQLLDAKFQELDKLAQRKADYGNEQYRIMERVMEDPSYMNRAREVKQKFGDDYSIPYADMFIAYNVDPDVLPNVQLMDELKKAGSMRRTADGKFIYKRNPDNDYIPNTAEHELSHFTDLLKSGRPDAHAGNNVFYQMTKDLTKRVGDKHDDYFLLPTEQKAHMNQLREWMFQNGYINRRDQKVTPEYMSKIMKQLNNVEGMKGVQRAAQQFKSNKTFTKWFNSVPLIGAGLLGVNKYFTDEDKQEK